ncbi:MAG: hypothetical protein JWQ29_1589 [Phenylobacterium sp.]|nr:hypothetical protein [Phenylobacterium sp.]
MDVSRVAAAPAATLLAPIRPISPAAATARNAPDYADKISRFQSRANTVLDAGASGADRLQAYQDVFGMAVKGDLLGMSDEDRALYDAAAGRSDLAQRAYQLQASYIGAVNAAARTGGAAAGLKAGLANFDGLSSADQQILFKGGIDAPDKTGAGPYGSVQGWRDNMSAQLKMVGYMRPDGVFDPNIAAKKADDPKFAAALSLANDRNNNAASWTQRVLTLFGGDAPKDRIDLSDAARAAVGGQTGVPAVPAAAAYKSGSIVSKVA